jgi:hypothetical protein
LQRNFNGIQLYLTMPFTFCHPAIVLPLNRLPKRWISISGLIAGSMVPDFEYFIRFRINSQYSHTWAGVIWFDLPLAFLLCLVYHYLIKTSLTDHAPAYLHKRMAAFKTFNWQIKMKGNCAVICVSIIAGAASHIFWDGFTHPNGYFVKTLPLLNTYISIDHFQLYTYKVLQHTSSLVGAFVILYVIHQLPKFESRGYFTYRYGLIILAVGLLATAIRFWLTNYQAPGNIIVTFISGCLIGTILASLLLPAKPLNTTAK